MEIFFWCLTSHSLVTFQTSERHSRENMEMFTYFSSAVMWNTCHIVVWLTSSSTACGPHVVRQMQGARGKCYSVFALMRCLKWHCNTWAPEGSLTPQKRRFPGQTAFPVALSLLISLSVRMPVSVVFLKIWCLLLCSLFYDAFPEIKTT
jgi:hypothetical protein